jgi:hypothetical protein
MISPLRLAGPCLLAFAAAAPPAPAQRSFVGKRLDRVFVDTEGHRIDPSDYRGAVLVMIAGIPW